VLKINKSLIKVAEMDPENAQLPVEGGNFTVTLENKGNGVYVEIPEDAKDWLSIASIAGNVVTFKAAANQGGDRETLITFKTTDGKKDYTAQQTLSQKGAIVECSVADFLAAEVGNTQYRITGVITKVARADYGNVYIRDWSGEAYVYGIGAKGDFEKLGLKVGDIVTLVGKRGDYKGTPQMTGAKYESHIPVATKTVAELRALNDDKNTWFMVTGVVTKPDEPNTKWDIETYGNLNLTDATGSIYVYGVSTGVNGKTKQFGTLNVKEGDLLTIIGYRTSYTKNEYTLLQMGGAMYVNHVPAD
jgi:RPA family protein